MTGEIKSEPTSSDAALRGGTYHAGNNLTYIFDPPCTYCVEKGANVCSFDMASRHAGKTCDLCHLKHRPCSAANQEVRSVQSKSRCKRKRQLDDAVMYIESEDSSFRPSWRKGPSTEASATRRSAASLTEVVEKQKFVAADDEGEQEEEEKGEEEDEEGEEESDVLKSSSELSDMETSMPRAEAKARCDPPTTTAPSGPRQPANQAQAKVIQARPRKVRKSSSSSRPSKRAKVGVRETASRFKTFLIDISKDLNDTKRLAATEPVNYQRKAKIYKHELQAVEARLRKEATYLGVKLPRARDMEPSGDD